MTKTALAPLVLQITRLVSDFDSESLIGQFTLFIGNVPLVCGMSLESTKDYIPKGRYTTEITYSPKFKSNKILINAQPRIGIRIHPALNGKSLDGCISLGVGFDYAKNILFGGQANQIEQLLVNQINGGGAAFIQIIQKDV